MKEFKIKRLEDGYFKVCDTKGEFSIVTVKQWEVHTMLGVLYAALNKNSVIRFINCKPSDFNFSVNQTAFLTEKFKVYINDERIFPQEVNKLYFGE